MEVELVEITEQLKRYEPFDTLPPEAVEQTAAVVEVAYYKADSTILTIDDAIHQVYFVRSGSVEIFRRNGTLYNRLAEGSLFGQTSLLMHNRVRFPARALEDSLLYIIPEDRFTQLCDQHDSFADYVELGDRARLRQAVSRAQQSNELMRTRVHQLVNREPVSVPATASVYDAGCRMTEEGVSSLLICAADDAADVMGIITDRDLRTRFIAAGLPLETPITEIMSEDLISVQAQQYVFEAMLSMLRFKIHHLPVMRDRRPVGVISLSDLIRYESQNSLLVVARILRAPDVEELTALKKEIEASFVRMVNEDANSQMIGSAMSVFGRSIKQRLLELAQEQLGPPPIPCCFVALGSMARDELLPGGDQDNALLLDNSYDPAEHGEYFEQLATFVCDGLAAAGYPYCKGGVMATTERWRQPREVWSRYFAEWIEKPTQEGLLNSSIFFDLDGVWGEIAWVEQLKEQIANQAKKTPAFLSALARNALSRTPPLGFFKDFLVERDGKHRNSLDLKRRGTAPLAALIRVHALAVGSTAQNSFDRLDDIRDADLLPLGRTDALRDALEFMSAVRLKHQAENLAQGDEVDNNINPENLSQFDRRNLKDAFQALSNAQKFLKFRYPAGRSLKRGQ
ncbi:MAG: putative nucleotidyltransferase substrate binding domain-containing protein [Pelovirga sp.]